MNFNIYIRSSVCIRGKKMKFINQLRTNRVSGVGMATSFERGVCRLIDASSLSPNPSIGRIHIPLWWTGWTHFGFLPLRVRVRLSSNGLAMLEISYGTPVEYRYSLLDFSRTISKDIIESACACGYRGTCTCVCVRHSTRTLKIANCEFRRDQRGGNIE